MAYNKDKPDAGKSPLLDASIIRDNFASFNSQFLINHTSLNSPSQGSHEAVKLTLQTSEPNINQDLAILFSQIATSISGDQPQLFSKIPKFLPTKQDTTDAKNNGVQLTYNSVNTAGPQYKSFLVGGYKIYFGNDIMTAPLRAILVILADPPKELLFISAACNSTALYDVSVKKTTEAFFTVSSSMGALLVPPPASFSWLAIGSV